MALPENRVEPLSDRPAIRFPSGLAGMLGLILVVELALSGLRDDLVTAWSDDWRLSSKAACSKAVEADILCFGDSLVKYGVLPKVIGARSGLKTYNLAVSSGTMASSYFLFRQAVESGAKPKAVVVDIAALMFLEGIPRSPRNYAELGTWRDVLDLGWTSADGDFLATVLMGKLLPSYRWRFELRQNILAAFDGRKASNPAGLISFRTLWNHEDGAQPTPTGRIYHPQEHYLIDGVSPERWACDPLERTYAERFLELAEARGIDVYWLIPPLSPGVHAKRAARGTDARYDRFVRSIVSKHPRAIVLDARPSGYDDSTHHDHIHLNAQGATVLSADLADLLLENLTRTDADRPNRRTLPPVAGRTSAGPRSNVARSRNSNPAGGTIR